MEKFSLHQAGIIQGGINSGTLYHSHQVVIRFSVTDKVNFFLQSGSCSKGKTLFWTQ